MSDAPELPPLPSFEPLDDGIPIYTGAHMQRYGRACQAEILVDVMRQTERAEKAERELADALALCNAANERAEMSRKLLKEAGAWLHFLAAANDPNRRHILDRIDAMEKP